jgi:predicted N-acetyltransferase YhbS
LRYERSPADDHFMVVELVTGALADASGVVRYLPEFAKVSGDRERDAR